MQTKPKAEKITVTIPHELKEQLFAIKKARQTSLSAIYKAALESYIRQEEMEKWENGAKMAAKDEEYLRFVSDIGDDHGDIYEYWKTSSENNRTYYTLVGQFY